MDWWRKMVCPHDNCGLDVPEISSYQGESGLNQIDELYSITEEIAESMWAIRAMERGNIATKINAQEIHERVTIKLKDAVALAEKLEYALISKRIK